MSATSFQRRRREIARLRVEALDVLPDRKNPTDAQDEPFKMTDEEIENANIEDVKKLLDFYDVKYAHNTGDAKLREKLADAING